MTFFKQEDIIMRKRCLFSGSRIILCCALVVCAIQGYVRAEMPDNMVVLDISCTPEYPRNGEGDFITLNSGTILFAYTQFYGGSRDHSQARIVTIESRDRGLTWSKKPRVLVENIGA